LTISVRLQLPDRFRPGEDRALAGREQDAKRLPIAAAARLGEVLARERLAGGAGRIELI
jgi:hypothetical protein